MPVNPEQNPTHESEEHHPPQANEGKVVFPGEPQPRQPNQAEQQSRERLGKPPPSESPASTNPQDPAELQKLEQRREQGRKDQKLWRQRHPEKHREKVARWRHTERGREYGRVYMREYRRKNSNLGKG